jgi:hypothetical protein
MDKHGDGETLCSLAMQYAIVKAKQNCTPSFSVSTITGISTLSDLEQNVVAAKRVLKTVGNSESLLDYTELDSQSVESRLSLAERVRLIIGEWLDYDFSGKKPKTVNSGSNGDDIKEPDAVDITAPKHKELKQPAAIRVMV